MGNVTPCTSEFRTHIQFATDHFIAARWYGQSAPETPSPDWHEKYHYRKGIEALRQAVAVLGFTLVPIQADPATAIDGGKQEGDDPISPVGGGDAPAVSTAERAAP